MAGWWRNTLLAVVSLSVGCAVSGPPKGQTGPVAWEVVDIVQTWEEQGTRLRWDYVVALTNSGSRGIYLRRMEITSQGRDIYGGMGTERLDLRLEPGQTLRLTRSDDFGCPQCAAADLPALMSEGLTKFLTIHGLVDGGDEVSVVVRIPLNSGLGRPAAGKAS
jgi:hypothetical protein